MGFPAPGPWYVLLLCLERPLSPHHVASFQSQLTSAVLTLQKAPDSSGELTDTRVAGPHPRASDSVVPGQPENLHFERVPWCCCCGSCPLRTTCLNDASKDAGPQTRTPSLAFLKQVLVVPCAFSSHQLSQIFN